MKISKIKFDLNTFNILLNPKGNISNREFLTGITILFIYIFYQISHLNIFQNILNLGYTRNNDFETITTINITPNLFTLPSISSFLIFVICIILSYKRAVDLNLKISFGIISGVIIYFGFYFIFFNSISFISFYSFQNSEDIIKNAKNYMLLYNLLSSFTSLTAIGLIIYFSIKKGEKEKSINEKTTKYILNLGKMNLLLIVLLSIVSLMYSFSIINIKTTSIIGAITIMMALIYYLYLNYMQSKNFRFLFYFNLIMLLIVFLSSTGVFFLIKNTSDIVIIKVSLSLLSIFNMLFLISNLAFISIKTDDE